MVSIETYNAFVANVSSLLAQGSAIIFSVFVIIAIDNVRLHLKIKKLQKALFSLVPLIKFQADVLHALQTHKEVLDKLYNFNLSQQQLNQILAQRTDFAYDYVYEQVTAICPLCVGKTGAKNSECVACKGNGRVLKV